jgi:hypothetical protein
MGFWNEQRTDGGVLERERHKIFDAFKWGRGRGSRETLADDNLDSAELLRGGPMALEKHLLRKGRKLEPLQVCEAF